MPGPQLSAFPEPDAPAPVAPSPLAPAPPRGGQLSAFPQDVADPLTLAVAGAPKTAPDTAARVFKLQLQTGLPHEVIERNLDDVEREAAAADFDPIAFRHKSPLLSSWLEAHPLHAAIAQDDLAPLSTIETAIRFGKNLYGSAKAGLLYTGGAGFYGTVGAALEVGDALGQAVHPQAGPAVLPLVEQAKAIRQHLTAVATASRGRRGNEGLLERAVLGGTESAAQMLALLPASLLTGSPAPLLAGMGVTAFGTSYGETRDAGKSLLVSTMRGAWDAGIEVATEFTPAKWFIGDVVKNSGLVKIVTHQLAGEVPGELIATTLQNLSEWAALHPDQPFRSYLDALPGALSETVISTIVAVGLQSGAGRLASAVIAKGVVEEIGRGAKASKLLTRSPQKLEEFVAHATQGGLETVYAPLASWASYWQSKGVDPDAKAAELTGNPQAYAEAVRTGEDLAIPVAKYAAFLAGTEHNGYFANELRLAPDEMNAREAEAFVEQIKAEPSPQGEAPSQVRTDVVTKLTAAGVEAGTAESYADLYESAFGNMATRAGVDPQGLYRSYGLKVERPDIVPRGTSASAVQPEAAAPVAAQAPPPAGPVAGAEATVMAGGPQATAAPVVPAGPVDEAGRALGGFAGAERRAAEGAGPGGLERRRAAADEPIRSMENLAAAVARMRVENPLIDDQAKAARVRAQATPRAEHPRVSSEATDADRPAAGADVSDRGGEQPATDRVGDPEGRGDRPRAERRRLPAPAEEQFTRPSQASVEARLTPEVTREVDRIREELETFPFENTRWVWLDESDRNTGNAAGGKADILARQAGAEVYRDILAYAPTNFITSGKKKGEIAVMASGTRGKVLEAVRALFETRDVKTGLAEGVLRVAERRAIEDYSIISRPWLSPVWGIVAPQEFTDEVIATIDDALRPANLLEDDGAIADADLNVEGDTSFNVDEFSQSLFDELQPPDPTVDVLATGEQQPRLPGDVGTVRDQEIATPQIDAPFSLTSQIAKPTKGGQSTLFQSVYHGSPHKFEAFSLHAIGSGEGAQSYGWGLYFAGLREVADRYRESLAGKPTDKHLAFTDSAGVQRNAFESGGLLTTRIHERDYSRSEEGKVAAGREVQGLLELHGRAYFAPVGKAGLVEIRQHLEKSLENFARMTKANETRGENASLETWSGDVARDQHDADNYKAAIEVLDKYGDQFEIRPPERPGRTYVVEIPENEDFLFWDKPASQQSPKVQAALKALGVQWETFKLKTVGQMRAWLNGPTADRLAREDIGIRESLREAWHYTETHNDTALDAWQGQHQGYFSSGMIDPTGETIYGDLAARSIRAYQHDRPVTPNGVQLASGALNAQGVAGIRYLDGQSRAAGEGTSNYVVFDEKLAQITEFDQGPVQLTPENVQAWAEEVKQRAGLDLQGFAVVLEPAGDLFLESLIVDRGAQRAGLGSKVMLELTRFADLNGVRLTLTPAQQGDIGPGEPTSTGRLVKFYKRFGFVENKGRHLDQSLDESMYREPSLPTMFGQPLFHGSPHQVEKFSTSKIGTGEGAQAYGWGLYFAENEGVARGYRDALSTPTVEINGIAQTVPSWSANLSPQPRLIRRLADARANMPKATEAEVAAHVRAALEAELTQPVLSWDQTASRPIDDAGRNALQNQLEILEAAETRGIVTTSGGAIYQVEIPDAQIAKMLDWDAGVEDQPESVKEALTSLGFDGTEYSVRVTFPKGPKWEDVRDAFDGSKTGNYQEWSQEGADALAAGYKAEGFDAEVIPLENEVTGAQIYRMLERGAGAQRASEQLAAAGVPGLRYLDAGSRNADGPGTRNVVVFDDSIVTLTHKDGTPVTSAERKEYLQVEQNPPQSRPVTLEELKAQGFDTSRPYYHQTAAANVEPIGREGFDLSKGRARLSDEQVPDGVFFKPTPADIGVGATGKDAAQIPVYLKFGKTLTFDTRRGLENHLARDAKYEALVAAARQYDKAQSVEFDRLWAAMRELDKANSDEHLAHKAEIGIDAFLDDWKAGNVDRASLARARATELLKAEGVDTVVIQKDAGSFGRSTETVIAISGNQVALAEPGGERIVFQEPPVDKPAGRRGAIRFGSDRQFTIALLERADLSTFLHESGHFFLEVFGDLSDQLAGVDPGTLTDDQKRLLSDYGGLLTWFGVESRGAIGTPQHEQFARAFEAYLLTGQAPGLSLQSSFSRFRAWLLGIYRSLKNLNVELTPEVRGILDRMLASDQAILEAEARRGQPAMFTTAAMAGMTPAAFGLYRQTIEDASRTAREQLDAQLLGEVQREQTAAWKAQRADVATAVEAEVNERREYRALAGMQQGTNPDGSPIVEGLETPPLKLSKATLVSRYGADRLKRFPKPYIYTVDGGMDPNDVARIFGFSSGDELLTAIEQAPPRRDVIAKETARRMIEQHGSLLLDGTLGEKAQAAVANEDRDRIIRAELRALKQLQRTVAPFVAAEQEKATQARKERDYERRWFEAETKLKLAIQQGESQVVIDGLREEVGNLKQQTRGGAARIREGLPTAALLRDTAKARLATMPIRSIRPAVFWSASRRAAQQAIELAARQDFDGAIAAKTQELINLALYREAERALVEVETRTRFAKDLATPARRKALGLAGASYLDQVDGILDRFSFATVSQVALDRRGSLRKFLEGLESTGQSVDGIPAELLDENRRRAYQELSLEEFLGVTDGLTAIVHLAQLKNRLLKAKDQREFQAVREAIVASIRAHSPHKPLPLEFRPADQKWRAISDWFASHRKLSDLAQALDGYVDGGPMWEAVIRPLNEAGDAEATRNTEAGKAYAAILERAYPGRELARLSESMAIPAIGASLSKEGRLAVALNWGNQTSRDRQLADPTRKWSQAQIEAILDTLDKRDWDFVQATWNYLNTFWPEIAAKQERVTGLAPEKVEALVVRTKFGEYAGGYYPLAYDSRLNPRAAQNEAASQAKLVTAAAYVRSTTKRGHVEARQAHVQLSVRLELSVAFQHLEQVIHDLTHHEALIDVTRIVRDSTVAKAILETKGDVVLEQFTRGLQDIAIGSTPAARTLMDKAANFARTGTQIAGLGWNLWTGAQQPLGVFNGMARVGPVWVARGMKRWLRDAASLENTVKWITSVSPTMANRSSNATQDLRDLRVTLGQAGGWFDTAVRAVTGDHVTQQTILDSFLWHIGLMQRVADVPTWLGQYEKSMAAGEPEARAIALADQAVLDSQGGGQVKDLSQFQRGGPIARLYLTFYSYGATVFNATARAAGETSFKSPASVAEFLGNLSLIYILPGMATVALAHAFGRADGDEPEEWIEEIGREMLATALNTMVGFRELGALAREGVRGYEGPAGARAISLFYNLARQVQQGDVDDAFWKAANAVGGVLFRYPAGQVQRTVDGWVALEEGRTQNPAALLFGAPRGSR